VVSLVSFPRYVIPSLFGPGFDGVEGYPPFPRSLFQEYRRNLERLDQLLANIETYIHVAFATLKKGSVVRRVFSMVRQFG